MGEQRPGGPVDCVRKSHWIGSRVGKTDHGFGHDGGFTNTPCVPYADAADCDPIALCAVTPPAAPASPQRPQAEVQRDLRRIADRLDAQPVRGDGPTRPTKPSEGVTPLEDLWAYIDQAEAYMDAQPTPGIEELPEWAALAELDGDVEQRTGGRVGVSSAAAVA